MQMNISNLVRNYFKAYETKNREALEELLCQDFTFSSPVDDKINRGAYFERCWPSCKAIQEYRIQNLFTDGDEAVIRYECELKSGATFRNMEHFRFEGNQIKETIVYFGFDSKKDSFADMKVKSLSKAFANGDTDYITNNIAEDINWHFVGEGKIHGKEAVRNMLEPMRGVVANEYRTKNIINHGNKAVIEGTMKMPKENGEETLYTFCDIYTFDQSNMDTLTDLTAYLIEMSNGEEK